MIDIEDAFVVFYAGTPLERVALRGVKFSIEDGEVVSILGNNGSGRSTLLRFLAGHIQLNFGRLWYDKIDITAQSLYARSKIVSSVFFNSNICTVGSLTVLENLALATMSHQPKSCVREAIRDDMEERFYAQLRNLDFMSMEKLLHEKVNDIPKPYKQVLALLIAVIKGAKVLVIDEHSTGLDEEASHALLETTNKIIRSKKMTTIMVVNDPEFALKHSDRLVVLNYGQVVANISGEEKDKIKLEDLYLMFNKKPKILDKKTSVNV